MYVKSTLIAVTAIISSVGSLPVQAQDRVTSEGQRLHQLCNGGDKGACIRFGMMFNENALDMMIGVDPTRTSSRCKL
jgi:hypothetical protein